MEVPFAEDVTVSDDTLRVDLSDGRSISAPLAWYPRLLRATPAECKRWRLIGKWLATRASRPASRPARARAKPARAG